MLARPSSIAYIANNVANTGAEHDTDEATSRSGRRRRSTRLGNTGSTTSLTLFGQKYTAQGLILGHTGGHTADGILARWAFIWSIQSNICTVNTFASGTASKGWTLLGQPSVKQEHGHPSME